MLNALLTMALAGSGGLLLCLALIRLGGRSLSARWQDWALRLCLLLLLVPLAPMAAALENAASAQTGLPAVSADAGTDDN